MARRTIEADVKAAVLQTLQINPDVNVAELAKQYGLSVPTVYNWRKKLLAPAEVAPVTAEVI